MAARWPKGFLGRTNQGPVTRLTSDGIRTVLQRLNAPPAHAWRRSGLFMPCVTEFLRSLYARSPAGRVGQSWPDTQPHCQINWLLPSSNGFGGIDLYCKFCLPLNCLEQPSSTLTRVTPRPARTRFRRFVCNVNPRDRPGVFHD